MTVFVSDRLSVTGYVNKDGKVYDGGEVISWGEFGQTELDTQIFVLDLNLEEHVSEAGRHSQRKIKGGKQDHFRTVFSDLTRRAVSHLNQGNTIVTLLAEEAPIPASRHRGFPRISSHDWLNRLGVMSSCYKLDSRGYSTDAEDPDLNWYLESSGEKYGISIKNDVNEYSAVVAESGSGTSIAAIIQAYKDDTREIRTDRGNLVLLPQPRTWTQSPTRIARCIEEIGMENLPDEQSWRKYGPRNRSSASTDCLKQILHRFPKAVRVLSEKDGSGKLEIKQESDVQDLLEAGLNLYFENVNSEVAVEDYAGSGGRIDLLINDINTAIEVKITRPDRSRSDLISEFAKAKEMYGEHSGVDQLYLFIYVSDVSQLPNGTELRNDIEDEGEVPVRLIITPQ